MRLKRLSMPAFWSMGRKEYTWVIRPSPGPHPLQRSIPLRVLIRDVLGFADTAAEAGRVLNAGDIMVDGKVRKDSKFPVGLMDVVTIPKAKKHFRVDVSRKGLTVREIPADQAGQKLCRIESKTVIKGGVMQLGLHDGRSIRVKEKGYKPLDSLLISVPDQKVLKHFKFETGATARVMGGSNSGAKGKIKEIKKRKSMLEKSSVTIKTETGEIQTPMELVFAGDVSAKVAAPKAKEDKK